MPLHNQPDKRKTLVGVLASHDDVSKNNDLAELFEELWKQNKDLLGEFHFVFTGGTFQRIVLGRDTQNPPRQDLQPIKNPNLIEFLIYNSTSLPNMRYGGVTILANLIVQRQCGILWPFLTPRTMHWLNPTDLALTRLSDTWRDKRLMNRGSAETWFRYEAERDSKRNPQQIPLKLRFGGEKFNPGNRKRIINLVDKDWFNQWSRTKDSIEAKDRVKQQLIVYLKKPALKGLARRISARKTKVGYVIPEPLAKKRKLPFWCKFQDQTLALIAHDEMKARMVDFAIEYERELSAFRRIIATGTTGRSVEEATRKLKGKIVRCQSGPKGGDIEIATEILYGRCDVVIFFIDPMHPHPHIEDIRTVFAACMIENEVRMLTNEVQAREWMDEVVRPNVQ